MGHIYPKLCARIIEETRKRGGEKTPSRSGGSSSKLVDDISLKFEAGAPKPGDENEPLGFSNPLE